MRLIFQAIFTVVCLLLGMIRALEAAVPAVRAVIAQDQHSVEITAPEGTSFVDGRAGNLPFLPQAKRVILTRRTTAVFF